MSDAELIEPWTDGDGSYPLPLIAEIAAMTAMSERTVRRHLKKAEAEGWLVIHGDRWRCTVPSRFAHLTGAVVPAAGA